MTAIYLGLVAAALACALDIVTTIKGRRLGLTEGNGVIAGLMRLLGPGWWIAKAALTGVLAYVGYLAQSPVMLFVVAAITAAAGLHNLRLIRKRT